MAPRARCRSRRVRASSGDANSHGANSGGKPVSTRAAACGDDGRNTHDANNDGKPAPVRLYPPRPRRRLDPACRAHPGFRCRPEYRQLPCLVPRGLQVLLPPQRQAFQSETTDVPSKPPELLSIDNSPLTRNRLQRAADRFERAGSILVPYPTSRRMKSCSILAAGESTRFLTVIRL